MPYICQRGRPCSAEHIDRAPSPEHAPTLASMGYELASVGKAYRVNVRCPVNGDGYWYTRLELLDSDGNVVGSFRDDSGPSGEL